MSQVLHSSRGKAFQRVMCQKDSKSHTCPGPAVWKMLVTVPFYPILYGERDSGRVSLYWYEGVVGLNRNMAMKYDLQDHGEDSFLHRFSDYKAASDKDTSKANLYFY